MAFEYLNTLNESQRQAATTIDGPLLIIAGAGSGKTTVLINRVAYMIDSGIAPENILMLTFTNKAADNMVERANNLSNSRCADITACTYHSFCAKVLRQYGYAIHLNKNFDIIAANDEADAIKYVKARAGKKYNLRSFPQNNTVVGMISKSVNMNISLSRAIQTYYPKYSSFIYEIEDLAKDYANYKIEQNILSYDDLLLRTLDLLQVEDIRKKLDATYQYIMVDEYQDTNALQEKILLGLCEDYQNIAVVGDDYQSIYAFRGSDINNILHFPDKFENCKKVTVDTNYRSTKEILDVANTMMNDYANFGYPKTMKDNHSNGKQVILAKPDDIWDEADHVLAEIKKYQLSGVPFDKIAILERKASSSAQIEIALTRENIPFQKLGGIKFLEYECVRDIMAYMRAIVNPHDELAWFRTIDVLPGIGDVYAQQVLSYYKEHDCLLNPDLSKHKFFPFLQQMEDKMYEISHIIDTEEQIDAIIDYYVELRTYKIEHAKLKDESERTGLMLQLEEEQNMIQLLKTLVLKHNDMIKFLDSVVLDANPEVDKPDGPMLTISTIHSAKGLEWDIVFILDCIEDIFPQYQTFGDDDFYEELRCMYVAVTRAKKMLYIESPMSASIYGKSVDGRVPRYFSGCSDFIKEMDSEELKEYAEQGIERRLSFEFVPQNLWCKNLRSELSQTDWDTIKKNVREKGECAFCHTKTDQLDAHERWIYDDVHHIQKLLEIVPVCKSCHAAIHFGFTNTRGQEAAEKAMQWFMDINHLTELEAFTEYENACDLWTERSEYQWAQEFNPVMLNKYLHPEKHIYTEKPKRNSAERHYLNVSYAEKDEAKSLGARWDSDRKKWYYVGEHNNDFIRWEESA
jgi:DNA helicase-2/ATP-dependent DNA helicase PcrA